MVGWEVVVNDASTHTDHGTFAMHQLARRRHAVAQTSLAVCTGSRALWVSGRYRRGGRDGLTTRRWGKGGYDARSGNLFSCWGRWSFLVLELIGNLARWRF